MPWRIGAAGRRWCNGQENIRVLADPEELFDRADGSYDGRAATEQRPGQDPALATIFLRRL